MNLVQVITKPIITERSLAEAATGVFTFEVKRSASKHQIKAAVEEFFGVDVVSVNTTVLSGDRYRAGKKRLTKVASPTKKARVKLLDGQKIDLFELEEGK